MVLLPADGRRRTYASVGYGPVGFSRGLPTNRSAEVCRHPTAHSPDVPVAIHARKLPGGLVAATVHRGPYDEEGPAYRAVEAWEQERGHVHAGPPREVYLTSPGEVSDPSQDVTEIQFPIVVPA